MPTPTRILVPVDFSACSREALDQAVVFAERFGATVDVMHVWEPPLYFTPELMITLPGQGGLTLAELARGRASGELEELLAETPRPGTVKVQGRLDTGDAWKTIVDTAAAEGYDLIVMGTHGRTGFSHLLMGSVAERVVRRASCPVLTVRRPEVAATEASAAGQP